MKPLPRGFRLASRALNVALFGSRHEMLCSRAWRRGWWWVTEPCDALFWSFRGEEDHCFWAWAWDFWHGNSRWPDRGL